MLQNYVAAAFRNLLRNGVYAVIDILGLALGFAAVILIALFVRDEYSYDRFIPDHDRIYKVKEVVTPPGEGPLRITVVNSSVGGGLKLDFPQIQDMTRLSGGQVALRHGGIDSMAYIFWADANFFDFFPLPAYAGNLHEALVKPDGLVLTRSAARRYFGREDVLGEAIEVDRKYIHHVTAILEDLPSNTHLWFDVILPGVASYSRLTQYDSVAYKPDAILAENTHTYVRLNPGAQIRPSTDTCGGCSRGSQSRRRTSTI
jgi:putative ABC transport system permease protein